MTSAWDAIRTKRAVRQFDGRPLEPAHLDRIVAAGRRAHSSKNQQRWAFIAVEDRAQLAELADARAVRRAHRGRRRRGRARHARAAGRRASRCPSCGTWAGPRPR